MKTEVLEQLRRDFDNHTVELGNATLEIKHLLRETARPDPKAIGLALRTIWEILR